jgi:hypothetical protein
MQAAQAAVIAATAAALSAAGNSSTGTLWSGCSSTPGADSSRPRLAHSMPGVWQSRSMCGAGAAAAASASAPGAVAGESGMQQQLQDHRPFTAAQLLLPDRLVAKLQHAVHDSQLHSQTGKHQHSLQLPAAAPGSARSSGSPRTRTAGSASTGSSSSRQLANGRHLSRSEGGATGANSHAQQQQQQQCQARVCSGATPKGLQRGLAVTTACNSQQPDTFFLQTGGTCMGVGQLQAASNKQQQQLECTAGTETRGWRQRSRTQEQQPGASPYLAAPLGLPVLAPGAVALAQQQLAAGSINLPSPRSSRGRTSRHTPRSAACNAPATVAVVSMALTAEGAAAAAAAVGGSTGQGQRRESCASPWPAVTPGRVRAGSCRAGGRCSVGGGGAADCGSSQGTPSGLPPPSSARRSSVAQLINVYGSSSSVAAGRLSSAGPVCPGPDAAPGKPEEWQTTGQTPRTGRGNGQASKTSSSNGGSSSWGSHAGAGAIAAGGSACSPAKPVPGGVFVQLDGPAWDAAEWAADTTSWCLSSRSSRQRAGPSSGCECAPGVSPRLLQHQRGAQVTVSPTAPDSTSNAAALVAAAEELLSKPLPPGSLGSGCRPVSLPGLHLSEDGGTGTHVDQAVSASPQQQQQQQQQCRPAEVLTACSTPSRSRPAVVVPRLQLATLHMPLAAGSGASSPAARASPAGVAAALSGSFKISSPKTGACCANSGWNVAVSEEQEQVVVGLPPSLPAFTPRRMWAPGGSRQG